MIRNLSRPLPRPLPRPLSAAGVGGGFNPASLFGGGEQGLVYDLSNRASLFVDSARTTPVTKAGDLIGSVSDLSPNGNHASQANTGNKPVWQTSYAAFDGSDDWWQTAAINFTATDEMTLVVSLTKSSDAAIGAVIELSANPNTTAGAFSLLAPSSVGGNNFNYASRGATTLRGASVAAAAPVTAVITGNSDISAPLARIRRDGGAWAQATTDQGGGNYGNHAVYVGRRAGSSLPFNGRIYRLFVINRALTAIELAKVEAWAGEPAGIFF